MHMGKIIERSEITSRINTLRETGRRVVFTNGCFDIIHAGHVRYLRDAKNLGDILIIGLNSDRSVASIKPGRPLVPQDQRAEVLSAMEMVDYVCIFDEDTPYDLIRDVRPDVLVKGADWKVEDIVGNDIVAEVCNIQLVKGISTSGIIEKIRKS